MMSEKMITVTQVASPLRRNKCQKEHLISLGLGKMNRTRVLKDSPSVRGLIKKVLHLIKVVEG
ncbi:MAG: 50S ribosomal protein L30 [Proteobacteria bacterium]|nr:50S ribosomal protein L30 [Pseudomonadota bacterium]